MTTMQRFLVSLLLSLPIAAAQAETFYVAAPQGEGRADGSSDLNGAADLSDFNWRRYDTLLLKRGTTLAVPLPGEPNRVYHKLQPNGASTANITLGAYGSGAKPVIRGDLASDYSSGWEAQGDDTYTREVQCSAGVVFYENAPLDYFDFDVPGWEASLAESDGGYAHTSAKSCVIRVKLPNGANPNRGGVTVSEIMIGFEPVGDTLKGLTIENIRFQGFSRQGINLRSVDGAIVQDNEVEWTGGDTTPKYELGGGIQISTNSANVIVRRNVVGDVWDSPISPQLPAGTNSSTLRNIEIYENTIHAGWGLAGIEVAIWNAGGSIEGLSIHHNTITWEPGFANVADGPNGPFCMIFNGTQKNLKSIRLSDVDVYDNECSGPPAGGIEVTNIATGKGDKNVRFNRNAMKNVGAGGPRGRSGGGSVDKRGNMSMRNTVRTPVEQDVEVDGQPHKPDD